MSFVVAFAVAIFCLNTSATLAASLDARRVLISQPELEKSIDQTALNSSKQIELVSRAKYSHLADFAYAQYEKIRDKHPDSFNANLLAGIASENDWEYQTSLSSPSAKTREVYNNAQSSLSRALELRPTSAQANMEYGYFLWQYGNSSQSASQGFSLIQRGVRLSPSDATGHALLGDVSSNPYGYYASHYSAARAAAEYQRAIVLDPLYARPHWGLVVLNSLLNNYSAAKLHMTKFLSLTPPDVTNERTVKILQSTIQKGLNKT